MIYKYKEELLYLFINFIISHYVEVLLDIESLQYCIAKISHKL